MQKIIVKHMTGSKANQTDIFELPIDAITFGREASCKVAYDPVKDDLVSRAHLKITLDESNQFLLTDLGSSNGTFVNEQKIVNPIILQAGDIVQLGKGGPKFEFDLDPRPPVAAKATRLQEIPISKSTRESQVSSTAESQYSKTDIQSISANQKQGVGRETVERLVGRVESDARIKIAETESKTRRKMINISAGIFTVIALVAGYLLHQNQESQKQLQDTEEHLKSNIAAAKEEQSRQARQMAEMKSNAPMSATKISQEYGPATVFIETSWKLRDVTSGQQLYQALFCQNAKPKKICSPAYIFFTHKGKEYVEPFLFTDDQRDLLPGTEKGPSIGGSSTGSGFVVDKSGFILTNSHVAAGWEAEYDIRKLQLGAVVRCGGGNKPCKREGDIDGSDNKYSRLLAKWIPADTKTLGGKPQTGKYIEGFHDYLEVTFPGLGQRSNARLTRISENADVALIKVDMMKELVHVDLSDGRSVSTGESVAVMGYPIISPDTSVTRQNRIVPEPTITTGIIGKVIENKAGVTLDALGKDLEKTLFKGELDRDREKIIQDHMINKADGSLRINELLYQLTINATGAGTSGGPVFDSKGKVIGIFTAMLQDQQGTQVSLALPIKYGHEIMK